MPRAAVHGESAPTNPVLPGYYPDPSVCRVDDDGVVKVQCRSTPSAAVDIEVATDLAQTPLAEA